MHYLIQFGPVVKKWLETVSLRGEGGRGSFCMFDSYESTIYCRTAIHGMRISCLVKKLLNFEGQLSDNFPTKIYRRNLVKIWSFLSILDPGFTQWGPQ